MSDDAIPRPYRLYFKTSDGELHAVDASREVADVNNQKKIRREISGQTRLIPAGAVLKVSK